MRRARCAAALPPAQVIHQTWKTASVQSVFAARMRSWMQLNPDWVYWFWSDQMNRQLIGTRYAVLARAK